MVDDPVLQREQSEEEMAVGGGQGESTGHGDLPGVTDHGHKARSRGEHRNRSIIPCTCGTSIPSVPACHPWPIASFQAEERTSDLTIARGRRYFADTAVRRRRRGYAWIGPRGSLAHCSQGWIAVQTFVGSWLGLVLSVWQGDRRIRITPARKFRMLLHINPTRQRGKRTGSLARASGWYMTFFAAGVIR